VEVLLDLAKLAEAITWPLLVFLLVGVVFRKAVAEVIGRIRSVDAGAFKALLATQPESQLTEMEKKDLQQSAESLAPRSQEDLAGLIPYSWHQPESEASDKMLDPALAKPYNMFWLGHDLMYAKAVALAGGTVAQIRFGLLQAFKHMKAIGMDKSRCNSVIQVAAMLIQTRIMKDNELSNENRIRFASALQDCIYRIGELTSR
jgi:hypothetical protein